MVKYLGRYPGTTSDMLPTPYPDYATTVLPMQTKVSNVEVPETAIDKTKAKDAIDEAESGDARDTEEGAEPSSDEAYRPPGREVPALFKRQGMPKGPCASADEEESRLRMQGVDGISVPLFLSLDVDGTPVYLPPMDAAEKLLKVPLTNHKSMETLLQGTAKVLAQDPRTGCRDLARVECWRDSSLSGAECLHRGNLVEHKA
eukprot:3632813-Rhodomonas_salina.1